MATPWWTSTVIYQIYPRSLSDSIGDGIGGCWSMLGGRRHEVRNLWLVNDGTTAVSEATAHYPTHGGAEVSVPAVSLLDRAADGRVSSLRVHIDLAPLLAQIGAESAEGQA